MKQIVNIGIKELIDMLKSEGKTKGKFNFRGTIFFIRIDKQHWFLKNE